MLYTAIHVLSTDERPLGASEYCIGMNYIVPSALWRPLLSGHRLGLFSNELLVGGLLKNDSLINQVKKITLKKHLEINSPHTML